MSSAGPGQNARIIICPHVCGSDSWHATFHGGVSKIEHLQCVEKCWVLPSSSRTHTRTHVPSAHRSISTGATHDASVTSYIALLDASVTSYKVVCDASAASYVAVCDTATLGALHRKHSYVIPVQAAIRTSGCNRGWLYYRGRLSAMSASLQVNQN